MWKLKGNPKGSKIKIFKEKGGYTLSEAETRKTIDLLEESDHFWDGVDSLRKKYHIPENGFPEFSRKYDLPYVMETENRLDKFFEDAKEVTLKLKLPASWWSSIAYFAAYGIFFTPEVDPSEARFVELERTPDEVVVKLILRGETSKLELQKLIDEEWPNIKGFVADLPTPPKHKMRRVALAKEIVGLRDDKKLKFSEILTKLSSKYEEDEELSNLLVSEEYIKMLYYRWKRKSNTYSQ